MNHPPLGLSIIRGRAMAYECVGITVVALVATASSLLHKLFERAHQQTFGISHLRWL